MSEAEKKQLGGNNRHGKWTPFCWRCPNGLWAKNVEDNVTVQDRRLNPLIFKGCHANSSINWENRFDRCPVAPEPVAETEPETVDRVAVFSIRPVSNDLLFLDTFSQKEHAEQWIINSGSENRKYIILPFLTGGKKVKRSS